MLTEAARQRSGELVGAWPDLEDRFPHARGPWVALDRRRAVARLVAYVGRVVAGDTDTGRNVFFSSVLKVGDWRYSLNCEIPA